jgi:hypothetical protein
MKTLETLEKIRLNCRTNANNNGYYTDIVIDNMIFLEIVEHIYATKGKEKKFWEQVMDQHKLTR